MSHLNIQRFVVNPFQENCYIVSDETLDAVIIDCGALYDAERKTVVDYIKANKLKVKHLLATHGHIDHNFGNNTLFDEFGIFVSVHAKDEYLMGKLHEQALEFCGFAPEYDFPPVGKYFTENDVITFGEHQFTIISTPGHTPGSVFFYSETEGVAFSGDTLFRMSIGRTDFECGSYEDIQSSLKKVTTILPDSTIILPGHGPQTTLGDERRMNPYIRMC